MLVAMIHTPSTVHIRQEGTNVVVIKNGRTIFDMPWDAALALAKAIWGKAKLAEEWASADDIVSDQALITRLGVPLGLTNNQHIRRAADREAAWNSELRRYVPGGIRSGERFGTPTIKNEGTTNGKLR